MKMAMIRRLRARRSRSRLSALFSFSQPFSHAASGSAWPVSFFSSQVVGYEAIGLASGDP